MRRAMLYVLVAIFALAGCGTGAAIAQEKQEKKMKAPAEGELRWHGTIVRWNKDHSTLDVRKGTVVKTIHYDGSTKWTQGTKPAEMNEFTEGSDVICLGKPGEKSVFEATRIDLRVKGQKP